MGKVAFGTTFAWNSQTVALLKNIGAPEISIDMLDVSSHQSADGFKEFLAGLKDGGEVSIDGVILESDTNGQIAMVTDASAGTSRTVVITAPGSAFTFTFTGLISKIKFGDFPYDGNIPFAATIKVSGKPALAITASNNATALTITTATLYPTFAQGTYSYVGTSTGTSLTFTPTFAAGTCSITNGTATVVTTSTVASGSLALGAAGTQTTFTMTIQETGKAAKVYTFVIAKTA